MQHDDTPEDDEGFLIWHAGIDLNPPETLMMTAYCQDGLVQEARDEGAIAVLNDDRLVRWPISRDPIPRWDRGKMVSQYLRVCRSGPEPARIRIYQVISLNTNE